MYTFVSIHRGKTPSDAKLIAATIDPQIVTYVAERLLSQNEQQNADLILEDLNHGRRRALKRIANSQDKKTAEESTK